MRDLYEYDEPNEIQVQSSAIAFVVNGFEEQQPNTKNGYPEAKTNPLNDNAIEATKIECARKFFEAITH